MTSANVTNILQVPGQIQETFGKSEDPMGDAFASLVDQALSAHGTSEKMMTDMSSNSSNAMAYVQSQNGANGPDSLVQAQSYEREQAKTSAQQDRITQNAKTQNIDESSEKIDELKEELTKLESEIKNVLEDELDVSEDELMAAMGLLGLTFIDLQDPSKLAALMNQLTGEENVASVWMNSQFTETLENLQTIFNDFSAKTGMDASEVSELVAMMTPVDERVSFEEVIENASSMEINQNDAVVIETKPLFEEKKNQSEAAIVSVDKITSENGEVTEIRVDETGKTEAVVTSVSNDNATDNESANEKSFDKSKSDESEVSSEAYTIAADTKAFDMPSEVKLEQPTSLPTVDVQSVIDQIVERTSSYIAADSSQTIEMVLHPESYGKLILHVTADKEGNVTAQIFTQNAEVKEALESQMAILRDNMNNNQGGKVQAIEVTVSSHEFEENLEQDAARDERNSADQAEKNNQNKVRNLNLNDLDELQGLMTEEEQLVASIMRDHGNTVNFTA